MSEMFKTGLIVADLARSMKELHETLGLEWTPVQVAQLTLDRAGSLEHVELSFVFSRSGPPYLELLQAQPSGYYAAPRGGELHHVGLWVGDLASESKRLAATGMPLEAAGVNDGRSPALFAFHTSPSGLRVELVDRANREGFEGWLAGGELEL